ncbi:MAG: hypothetical protein COA66_07880 [Arcobacter sp.]|nr:MAG: hypothetical protein COA66_07880 [Arcobacter sp.]
MSKNNFMHKTKYEGVYYKELLSVIGQVPDLSYYVIYRSDGKQKKKSVGKKSQRMTATKANQIRNDILYEIKYGINSHTQKNLTLQYLTTKWHEDKKDTLKAVKEEYQRVINHFSFLLTKNIEDINTKDIEKVYSTMLEKGITEQTFQKVYSMFKRVVNHAIASDYIQSGPIIRFNRKIKNNKITETYSDEMIEDYLKVIDNYEDQIIAKIVKLIYTTGMRRAEPLKIKWKHYSFVNSTVKIVDAKSGHDEIYYLSNNAKSIIESQKGLSKEYIFEQRPGVPIGKSRLSYHAVKMKLKAGLPDEYRPLHSLRHHFGTVLARNGLNAFQIQKTMTHKDIKTTQRYIDLSNKDIIDDLNKIEQKQSKI